MKSQEYPSPRDVVPFPEWIDRKYGQPVFDKGWKYKWDPPEDHFETRATYAEYVVWTWEDPLTLLATNYSVAQIGGALWSEHHVYLDSGVPEPLRQRAWAALPNLFTQLFAQLCSPTLGHLSESVRATESIDSACYMWWDVGPYYPGRQGLTPSDHQFFLDACAISLRTPHAAVQESALHGLGHAANHQQTNRAVNRLIAEFLVKGLAQRKELIRYAKQARVGGVQ